jgi:hypothetical protein
MTRLSAALCIFLAACAIVAAQDHGALPFDPAHQRPVTLVTPEFSAAAVAQPANPTTGQTRLIRLKTRAGESSIALPFGIYQVNSIISGPGKLVVVGMAAGAIYEIAIIDVASARLLDYFTCYSPAVSPNGRYIAYTKLFAPHGTPSPDDHAMLYDVAKSPLENRPPGVRPDDYIDVGFALYPPGIGNREGDNVDVPTNLVNVVAGYYFWEGHNQYFFANRSADEFKVVWVTVNGSIASVRDVVIPPAQLPAKQSGFPPRLVDVSLEGDHVNLSLMSTAQRTIQVSLPNFISIESVDLGKPPLGAKQ